MARGFNVKLKTPPHRDDTQHTKGLTRMTQKSTDLFVATGESVASCVICVVLCGVAMIAGSSPLPSSADTLAPGDLLRHLRESSPLLSGADTLAPGDPTAPILARYRCFLPDLAGLAGLRRVGPGTEVSLPSGEGRAPSYAPTRTCHRTPSGSSRGPRRRVRGPARGTSAGTGSA